MLKHKFLLSLLLVFACLSFLGCEEQEETRDECPSIVIEQTDKFEAGMEKALEQYKDADRLDKATFSIMVNSDDELKASIPKREDFEAGEEGDKAYDTAYQAAMNAYLDANEKIMQCTIERAKAAGGVIVPSTSLIPVFFVQFPDFDTAVEFSYGSDVKQIEVDVPSSPGADIN